MTPATCATGWRRRRWAPPRCWRRNLRQFGAEDIRERSHDVKFQGTLEAGVSRVLVVARREPRAVADRGVPTAPTCTESALRRRAAPSIGARRWAPGRPRSPSTAPAAAPRRSRTRSSRGAEAQGRGLRQSARRHGRASEHSARAPRRTAAFTRREQRHGVGVARFFRRESASPRLSQRRRPRR